MYAIIVKKYQKAACLLAGGVLSLASFLIPACAHAEYVYAQVAGFETVGFTPVPFNFLGVDDLEIQQLTPPGDGLMIGTDTVTFSPPGAGPWNPAWVAGKRDFYEVAFENNSTPGDTVNYQFTFTGGLATSSYLVFSDFELG